MLDPTHLVSVRALRAMVLLALVGFAAAIAAPGCDSDETPTPAGPGGTDAAQAPTGDAAAPDDDASEPDADDGPQGPLIDCDTDADCPASKPACAPSGWCVECIEDSQCPADETCQGGLCQGDGCTPGETVCNLNTLLTCNATGTGWLPLPCTGGECIDGECVGCAPGFTECIGQKVVQCLPDGSGFDTLYLCADSQYCIDGACYDCYPGTTRCDQGKAEVCNLQGDWEVTDDCALLGLECASGICVSDCLGENTKESNQGCDYWAVDLDNHFDAMSGPYAVIVSNLSEDTTATVSVTTKDNAVASEELVVQKLVPPGGLVEFTLPQRNMGDAGVFWTAYRVRSNAPIVAYQFNPLDNEGVFSNDASLLLPVNALGQQYFAVSRWELQGGGPEVGLFEDCQAVCGQIPGGTCTVDPASLSEVCSVPYRGFVTVVGSLSATTVTVTPTTATLAGGDLPALAAGESHTVTLEPYQVLNIKSDVPNGDLTGTRIESTKPVAVFSGHEAAVSGNQCCADHLEQQLYPTTTWGKTYVAAKSYPRANEQDFWRIVALEGNTNVQITPSSVSPTKVLTQPGAFTEIGSAEDFVIQADKPVLVSQILASSYDIAPGALGSCASDFDCPVSYSCENVDPFGGAQFACVPPTCANPNDDASCPSGHACSCQADFFGQVCQCAPVGDPALILTAPVEQFRQDYVFLVPGKYELDYLTIVAPAGAAVQLDGQPVLSSAFTAVGDGTYTAAKLPVADGVHTVTADQPVGVTVYGYDDDVSYGYTAGLNLEEL